MNEAPLLSVKDLSKAFGGVQAVNRVSFDLNKGDLLGIIGPNGSGKTTTGQSDHRVRESQRGEGSF